MKLKFLIFIFIFAAFWVYVPKAEASAISRAPNNLGLVGYWPLNEGTSTTSRTPFAEDYSGNNNRGTLTNMAFPASATSGWADGKLGRALNFDGVNDYVSGPSNFFDFNTSYTYSMWVKPSINITSSSANMGLLEKRIDGGAGEGLSSAFENGVGWRVACHDSGPSSACTNYSAINLRANTWYHLAVTWNKSTVIGYIDGISVASGANSTVPGSSSGTNLAIGVGFVYSPDAYFNGLIDEVRIYNRVLSADEIKRLYNQGR